MESIGPLHIGLILGVIAVGIVAIVRRLRPDRGPATEGARPRPAGGDGVVVASVQPAARSTNGGGHQSEIDDVRSYIHAAVRGGFEDREEILEAALEMAEEEGDEESLARIPGWLDVELAKHAKEEASWPARTDCDRLDAAFVDLEARGILALQHFSCCLNCGNAEIGAEMEEAGTEGPVVGYAFYHSQDTERAVEGGDLCLAFGSPSDDEPATSAVARTICQALEASGLRPRWGGQVTQRIVVPMEWKRRRQGLDA
jgi:hypothetical protein